MKIKTDKIKKSCRSCRAFKTDGFYFLCSLCYKIDMIPRENRSGCLKIRDCDVMPLELCPKPLTFKELIKTKEKV